MEILLNEIKRIPYARALNIYRNGIYFHTYKRRNPKPGDTIYPIDLGVFRIEYGSETIEKVIDKEIENYSVVGDKIFYKIERQIFQYDISKGEEVLCPDYTSMGYNFLTKNTFLHKPSSAKFTNECIVFFDELESIKFARSGRHTKSIVLVNEMMNFNELKGYNCQGEELWETKISSLLNITEDRFNWRTNRFEQIYPIKDYWIIYYYDNLIIQLKSNGHLGWYKLDSEYHTYIHEGEILYGTSGTSLAKFDAQTGRVIMEKNIEAVKAKYDCNIYQGGMWIYEDFIFIPTPKTSIEWLLFEKNTLEEVGRMRIKLKNDEIVLLPGQFCSNFIYSKKRVYIHDTADWFKIFDVEFKN